MVETVNAVSAWITASSFPVAAATPVPAPAPAAVPIKAPLPPPANPPIKAPAAAPPPILVTLLLVWSTLGAESAGGYRSHLPIDLNRSQAGKVRPDHATVRWSSHTKLAFCRRTGLR